MSGPPLFLPLGRRAVVPIHFAYRNWTHGEIDNPKPVVKLVHEGPAYVRAGLSEDGASLILDGVGEGATVVTVAIGDKADTLDVMVGRPELMGIQVNSTEAVYSAPPAEPESPPARKKGDG